jgi:hypothetical protein
MALPAGLYFLKAAARPNITRVLPARSIVRNTCGGLLSILDNTPERPTPELKMGEYSERGVYFKKSNLISL